MKKDNYRTILSEKFKAANQLETGPLTEEDEEYLRILAEARANHAKIKAARQEARKRLAARVAAVLIIAALVSSSYLLGMKSDTKANADNDDEVKVVQQGDNIIIGPGVSEDDENVGVVTKTYYRLEDVPEEVLEEVDLIGHKEYNCVKVKCVQGSNINYITTYYHIADNDVFWIQKCFNKAEVEKEIVLKEVKEKIVFNGIDMYKGDIDNRTVYSFEMDSILCQVSFPEQLEQNKKEVILKDLICYE